MMCLGTRQGYICAPYSGCILVLCVPRSGTVIPETSWASGAVWPCFLVTSSATAGPAAWLAHVIALHWARGFGAGFCRGSGELNR